MSEYNFTQDWFKGAEGIWTQVFSQVPVKQKIMEIGSYEGRSACWLIENALEDGGTLYCVDTWEGGEEHKAGGVDMQSVQERFEHNITTAKIKRPGRNVVSLTSTSYEALASFIATKQADFDFIYIDGSHQAPDVLTDACMAFGLLKIGGVMVFDDYIWAPSLPAMRRPKIAIDMFVNIFEAKLRIVYMGHQFIIQRTA